MSYSLPLNENVQGSLNASGNALLLIGPKNAYQEWDISSVSVNTSTANKIASFNVYLGTGPNGQFLGGTYNGAQNSANISVKLFPGQVICGVFAGGDPGAIGTMAVSGTVTVP